MSWELDNAKGRYEACRADTDLHQMYEGRSTRTGGSIYQAECDAARAYIAALLKHIEELTTKQPKHRRES